MGARLRLAPAVPTKAAKTATRPTANLSARTLGITRIVSRSCAEREFATGGDSSEEPGPRNRGLES